MSKGYRDLIAWQKAMALVPLVYRAAKKLPKEETYALSDQIRRAVISVPANIAEGQARQTPKEFVQFLYIARGSLAELETLLLAAQSLNYLDTPTLAELEPLIAEIRKILQGLIGRLTTEH